jgi:pimeloyl-ACP methyl ester carboxylesterase
VNLFKLLAAAASQTERKTLLSESGNFHTDLHIASGVADVLGMTLDIAPRTEVEQRIGADTSVPRLAPLGLPQVLINGRQDRIIPTAYAEGYARPMRAAGDDVRVRMLDATGHVELIAPGTAAWAAAVEELRRALQIGAAR